uniref:Choline/ethanolamine kinase n=1 Tax=Ditylenchus dipsaci TaxID=166011 RepID=A0A915DE49_9BILA
MSSLRVSQSENGSSDTEGLDDCFGTECAINSPLFRGSPMQKIRRSFTEMPIQHDKHLRSMKELLSQMIQTQIRTRILSSRRRPTSFVLVFWVVLGRLFRWTTSKLTELSRGACEQMFLCRLTENHPPIRNEPDKVLLRVYFNPETESHLVAESVIFTLLSERHLGPKLYGIFSGGRLEEYIPSRPLTCQEISLSAMSKNSQKSGQGTPTGSATITCDDLFNESRILRACFPIPKARSSPDEHSDSPNNSNSLSAFNPMDPRLVLIDFEYASYNYRGFDFANHFVDEEQMTEFMFNYLKELNPNSEDKNLYVTAAEMVKETIPFIPVSHLFWGVWGLLQVEVSPVGFGFAEYGRERLGIWNTAALEHFFDYCLTIAKTYFIDYKLEHANGTEYQQNFFSYLGVCSQIPNLLLNFLNLFIVATGASLSRRIFGFLMPPLAYSQL